MRYFRFALASLFLATVAAANAPASKEESLTTVTKRLFQALLKEDWKTARRECAPTIGVFDFERGYEFYFSSRYPVNKPSTNLDIPGEGRCIVTMATISNEATLSKEEKILFSSFCDQVKASRLYTPEGWGVWPASGEFIEGSDIPELSGPAAEGKCMSNVYIRVEFAHIKGSWKASRFIVQSH